jgi:hypothetical protein
MILKYIYLYLNTDEYADQLGTEFGFRTRYICNYIERHMKAEKHQTDGFNRICVQGRDKPAGPSRIVSENALISEVKFDREQYQNLQEDGYHEFFLDMLERGLEKAHKSFSLPLHLIRMAIDQFRVGGYVNHWEHKRKRLRNGLVARLLCDLNMYEFVLTLSISKSDQVLFERQILKTKPDEIIYKYQFKDMEQSGDKLLVKNKFGKKLYSLKLTDL